MFLPGAIQAATGMIISYPFDTIKSKMQKNPKVFNTTYNTIKKTFIKEGFKGFYRGIPIPLSVIVIKRGFQYDLYEKLNKKKLKILKYSDKYKQKFENLIRNNII